MQDYVHIGLLRAESINQSTYRATLFNDPLLHVYSNFEMISFIHFEIYTVAMIAR